MTPTVEDVLQEILGVMDSLSGMTRDAQPSEDAVWSAYARLERAVAILKTRLRIETPGVLRELPKADDSSELVEMASERLSEAVGMVRGGRPVEGLEAARKARDCLRAYLVRARRARLREMRARRSSGAPRRS